MKRYLTLAALFFPGASLTAAENTEKLTLTVKMLTGRVATITGLTPESYREDLIKKVKETFGTPDTLYIKLVVAEKNTVIQEGTPSPKATLRECGISGDCTLHLVWVPKGLTITVKTVKNTTYTITGFTPESRGEELIKKVKEVAGCGNTPRLIQLVLQGQIKITEEDPSSLKKTLQECGISSNCMLYLILTHKYSNSLQSSLSTTENSEDGDSKKSFTITISRGDSQERVQLDEITSDTTLKTVVEQYKQAIGNACRGYKLSIVNRNTGKTIVDERCRNPYPMGNTLEECQITSDCSLKAYHIWRSANFADGDNVENMSDQEVVDLKGNFLQKQSLENNMTDTDEEGDTDQKVEEYEDEKNGDRKYEDMQGKESNAPSYFNLTIYRGIRGSLYQRVCENTSIEEIVESCVAYWDDLDKKEVVCLRWNGKIIYPTSNAGKTTVGLWGIAEGSHPQITCIKLAYCISPSAPENKPGPSNGGKPPVNPIPNENNLSPSFWKQWGTRGGIALGMLGTVALVWVFWPAPSSQEGKEPFEEEEYPEEEEEETEQEAESPAGWEEANETAEAEEAADWNF